MNWLALILLSSLVHSFWTLALKHDLKRETNTQIIALYPLVGVLLLPLFTSIDYGVILTSTGWMITLKTLSVALALFCFTLALKELPVSIYAPLQNTSPIFLLILSTVLLGEQLGPLKILGLLIIIGAAMLLDVDLRQKGQVEQIKKFIRNPKVFLMLLGAFIVSFAAIFDRLALKETDPFTNSFYFLLILSVIYWAFHTLKERQLPFQGVAKGEWPWLILTGSLVLVSDLLLYTAIKIPGTLIVVLIGVRRLSTFWATIFGGKLFHEDHLWYKGTLCVVMILGTILLVL